MAFIVCITLVVFEYLHDRWPGVEMRWSAHREPVSRRRLLAEVLPQPGARHSGRRARLAGPSSPTSLGLSRRLVDSQCPAITFNHI